jgi:hypothetical protein
MTGRRTVISLLSIACLTTTLALAQNEAIKTGPGHERQGFWIGFGFGGGSGGFNCSSGCADTAGVGGAAVRLALGGTVNRHVKIGGEVHGWVNSDPDIDESIGTVTGSVYYYPSATGNFFLQGGVGSSVYLKNDGFDEYEATGLGTILGIGYDIFLGRKFSLTPILAYGAGWSGELQRNSSGTGSTLLPNFITLTISPTWH